MSTDRELATSIVSERPLGWLLALVIPFVSYLVLRDNGIEHVDALFVGVVSASLVLWMFSLVPDLLPALLAMLLCMLLGLAPPEVVLSGFSSDAFLLTVSVLGLGVVVTSSGLTYRYALWLVKRLPPNTFWYQIALFVSGLLFTPIVPSIAGRAAMTGPILGSMIRSVDADTARRSSGMLYFAGLDSTSFLTAAFLTSTPANLIIFGMLPAQEQQAFQFIHWAFAASAATAILIALYFVISGLYFRTYTRTQIDMHRIDAEIARIGSVSAREWLALLSISALALGIMTSSIHKAPIAFVIFTIFFVLLYLNVLTREDFVKKIDWSFLFLLAGLIGILKTMSYLGLDKVLTESLSWLGDYMISDFETFILLLSLVILLARLSLPINSVVLLFSAALIPVAHGNGVSPWLIGFVILMMSETSLFPYQSPHIALFRDAAQADAGYRDRDFFVFHFMLIAAKLIAIYASIPFWQRIGVL